jgi:hypothetical protein
MNDKHRRLLTKALYGSIQQKSLENMIRRELVLNYGYDNKLAIAESLAARIMELFNEYAPDREQIKPFQVLWMAVDQYDPPAQGKTIYLGSALDMGQFLFYSLHLFPQRPIVCKSRYKSMMYF